MSETALISLRDKSKMQFDSTRKQKPGDTPMIERRPQPVTEVTEETMDVSSSEAGTSGAELAESVLAELDTQTTSEAEGDDVQDSEPVQAEPDPTSVTEFLAPDTSLRTVRPRILITFSITDTAMYDCQAALRKPATNLETSSGIINLYNPLAKENTAKGIGAGALRKALPGLFEAVDLLARQPIVVMGEASAAVQQVTDNIWSRVSNEIIDSFSPSEEGTYEIESGDDRLVVSINDLISVNSWSVTSQEDESSNSNTEVVTQINVNAPILYNGDNTNKFLYDYVKTLAAIIRTVASKHASNTDVSFGVVLSTNLLASASVRTLFTDMMEMVDDNEQSMYEYITLADMSDSELQTPTLNTLFGSQDRNTDSAFAHGGSMMFVTNL